MQNPLNLIRNKLFRRPTSIPVAEIPTSTDLEILKAFRANNISSDTINKMVQNASMVSYERTAVYQEVDRALAHPLMSAAVGVLSDLASNYNQNNDASVWCIADNGGSEYVNQWKKFAEIINLEEIIYDLTYSTASLGDLFMKLQAEPGIGVASIDTSFHPVEISRLDLNGQLIGFYETPGLSPAEVSVERGLLSPWSHVHLRLLSSRRRRLITRSPTVQEYKSLSVLTPDIRLATTQYGSSYLLEALPAFKRLRLAEDSIMMSRINRGVLRYIWKVVIENGGNMEAVKSMLDSYSSELRSARAMDTSSTNPNYAERTDNLAAQEDIILPVFGSAANLSLEKLGDSPDIKWIADVVELRNQLSCALKIPLQILGGYQSESGDGIGSHASLRQDIRFARQCRRLQRAIICGLTRAFQIHLAYQNIAPDLTQFQLKMTDTSTAEEEELKEALEKGVEVVDRLSDIITKHVDVDKFELLDYLNKKILKLNDLDLVKMARKVGANIGQDIVPKEEDKEDLKNKVPFEDQPNPFRESADYKAFLPSERADVRAKQSIWESKYKDVKVRYKKVS